MSKAPGFQRFWSVFPQDIQREILQELTYIVIKPNKPIYTQGIVLEMFGLLNIKKEELLNVFILY